MTLTVNMASKDTLLMTTSGGSYVDEITHKQFSAGSNDSLKTVISPGATRASLTPMTTFAAARAQALAASGDPLSDSVAISYAAVARQYNLTSIADLYPEIADVPPDQQVETASYESRQLGLELAGFDQEAGTLGVTDFGLTDAVAEDMSDGDLDGKDGAQPVLVDGTAPLPADATTKGLQAGIDSFSASPANVTKLASPQIALEAPHIDLTATGGLALYVWTSVLPAFLDGAPATAPISSRGGTPPITCVVEDGQLPAGFTLLSDCSVHYDGRSVLGAGHMLVSAAFTVRMSDASKPMQSVTAELRITVLTKPPTIFPQPGKCAVAGQPCTTLVATATGGVPPYMFYEQGGPLGMFMETLDTTRTSHPDLGDLQGNQGWLYDRSIAPALAATREGVYSFKVCVVDDVGFETCAPTTLTVGPGPSPSETTESPPPGAPNNLPPGFPTDLPGGDYDMAICINGAACTDMGTVSLSAGDASALDQSLSSAVASVRAGCDDCTVQYTAFNGQEFDIIITGYMGVGERIKYSAEIRITKVR